MPAYEELIAQKREIEERKLALEKYRLELVRIQSNLNAIMYRANSIGVSDYELEAMDTLKAQKKLTLAGLKRDYQLAPHLIPGQIKECNHQISMISMQLDRMEQHTAGEPSRQPGQSHYDDLYDSAKEHSAQFRHQEQSQDDRER